MGSSPIRTGKFGADAAGPTTRHKKSLFFGRADIWVSMTYVYIYDNTYVYIYNTI